MTKVDFRGSQKGCAVAVMIGLGLILAVSPASAKAKFKKDFTELYPAAKQTKLDSCKTCHTQMPKLNPYGEDLKKANNNMASIEKLDSDRDGVLNIDEIKALTQPGNPEAKPAVTPAKSTETTLEAKPGSAKTPKKTKKP